MKTADAGYLTRRLVDVAQDVIITDDGCGTLRGLAETALKNQEEVVESLFDRILGRVSLHDIFHPITGKLIVKSGDEIVAALREDVPVPCLPHTEDVKNAPETDGDFFKVPKVIER